MYFNKLMKVEIFFIFSYNWTYAHECSNFQSCKNIPYKEVYLSHSLFSHASFQPGQWCFYLRLVSCITSRTRTTGHLGDESFLPALILSPSHLRCKQKEVMKRRQIQMWYWDTKGITKQLPVLAYFKMIKIVIYRTNTVKYKAGA